MTEKIRGVHRTHTPRRTSTGYSAATIDMPVISADAHRTGAIAYTVFMYGHIQGVGVTAYRLYNNVHTVKLKRWGQMLIGNSGKNSLNNSHDVYINHGKILFPSGHLEA